MADLGVNVRPGLVVAVGAGLGVNVDGAIYSQPWWPQTYVPTVGDAVRVLLCAGEASILGATGTSVRAATGTVAGSAVNGLLPVTVNGATVQCRYLGSPPTTGTLVLLSWQSTTPWVMGSAAASTPTATTTQPTGPSAPPATTSGTLTLSAIDSGTYTNIWWRQDVRQGTYSGVNYYGAWFYGSGPGQLAGATITGFRIRLGARLQIGSYNSVITAHLYRVTQGAKPSGVPTYTDGPNDVSLAVQAGAQWVSLPASVGQDLVNAGSGGMGLTGAGYGGVEGLGTDPASGQIALDWTR